MATNHSTNVFRYEMSDDQRGAFHASGKQLWCKHCVHPAPEGGELRAIPAIGPYQAHDSSEDLFCSTSCMMAYTFERPSYRSQMQRSAIQSLHHDEHDGEVCTAASPQCMLDVFAGPWDIDTFRGQASARRLVRRCASPFVSPMTIAVAEVYQMDAGPAQMVDQLEREEVDDDNVEPEPADGEDGTYGEGDGDAPILSQLNEWGLTNLRRPTHQPCDLMETGAEPEASVYQRYLDQVNVTQPEPPEPARRPPRARPTTVSGGGGGLARYLKKA
jgi:hypothetical protein